MTADPQPLAGPDLIRALRRAHQLPVSREYRDSEHVRAACEPAIAEIEALRSRAEDAERALAELKAKVAAQQEDLCQTLGQALGYPWFKDDQKNFPGSTEEHGVCVGDHVAESLADEAAERIRGLAELKAEAQEVVGPFADTGLGLERRAAGGWRRVDQWGGIETILEVTFTDLEPFERASALLSKLKGEDTSSDLGDGSYGEGVK